MKTSIWSLIDLQFLHSCCSFTFQLCRRIAHANTIPHCYHWLHNNNVQYKKPESKKRSSLIWSVELILLHVWLIVERPHCSVRFLRDKYRNSIMGGVNIKSLSKLHFFLEHIAFRCTFLSSSKLKTVFKWISKGEKRRVVTATYYCNQLLSSSSSS